MPQMMPLNWLELYMYFSILFMMMIIMNFYMFNYTTKNTPMTKMKMKMNWKW